MDVARNVSKLFETRITRKRLNLGRLLKLRGIMLLTRLRKTVVLTNIVVKKVIFSPEAGGIQNTNSVISDVTMIGVMTLSTEEVERRAMVKVAATL